MAIFRRCRLGGILVLLLVLGAACASDERPNVAEWRPAWESFVAEVPSADELGDPPDQALCSGALGVVRERRNEIVPTPDPAIDSVVNEWLRIAEDMLFECPPSSEQVPDLASGYAQLRRLEAEIDAVLDIDESEG